MTTAEETAKRSEDLRAAVKLLRVRHEGKVLDGITFSMGIAGFPEHSSSEEELLRLADIGLYQSKSRGRDRITIAIATTNG
jgi:two-component system cell cycle response regulator